MKGADPEVGAEGDSAAPEDQDDGEDGGEAGDDGSGDGGETIGDGRSCEDRELAGSTVDVDGSCELEPAVGTFSPVLEWSFDDFSSHVDSDGGTVVADQIMSLPIVTQLTDDNGDGTIDRADTPDVVVMTFVGCAYREGVLRAVSGDGSGELWTNSSVPFMGSASVAAGDLDGDGTVELVSVTRDDEVVVLEHDGSLKWTSAPIAGGFLPSVAPAIVNLDRVGSPEIVLGRAWLDASGSLLAQGAAGNGGDGTYASASVAADLDGTGGVEIVVGNAAYNMDGTTLWSNGERDGFAAVADFDGDGLPEVAVAGQGQVRLQNGQTGGVLWSVDLASDGPYYGGPPTIADFDGDGVPELGVAEVDNYTVYEGDGSVLWSRATVDGSSGITGSSVFDFEGDGVAEVVHADETTLWVFSGLTGATRLQETDHSQWTLIGYPLVVDVDGDDEAEILVARSTNCLSGSGTARGLAVFGDADGTWRPARRSWNQHAWDLTNADDDGAIPTSATPSWTDSNTFRSADLDHPDGLAAPKLAVSNVEICSDDCDENSLRVWVEVDNTGPAAATDTHVLIEVADGAGGSTIRAVRVADDGPVAEGGEAQIGEGVRTASVQVDVPIAVAGSEVTVTVSSSADTCEDIVPVVVEGACGG